LRLGSREKIIKPRLKKGGDPWGGIDRGEKRGVGGFGRTSWTKRANKDLKLGDNVPKKSGMERPVSNKGGSYRGYNCKAQEPEIKTIIRPMGERFSGGETPKGGGRISSLGKIDDQERSKGCRIKLFGRDATKSDHAWKKETLAKNEDRYSKRRKPLDETLMSSRGGEKIK